MRVVAQLPDGPVEVEAWPTPVGSGALVLHRHPTQANLWCLTHCATGVLLATSWRYRTLVDALRKAWRIMPRRERDLVAGKGARPRMSNTDGAPISSGRQRRIGR